MTKTEAEQAVLLEEGQRLFDEMAVTIGEMVALGNGTDIGEVAYALALQRLAKRGLACCQRLGAVQTALGRAVEFPVSPEVREWLASLDIEKKPLQD